MARMQKITHSQMRRAKRRREIVTRFVATIGAIGLMISWVFLAPLPEEPEAHTFSCRIQQGKYMNFVEDPEGYHYTVDGPAGGYVTVTVRDGAIIDMEGRGGMCH